MIKQNNKAEKNAKFWRKKNRIRLIPQTINHFILLKL